MSLSYLASQSAQQAVRHASPWLSEAAPGGNSADAKADDRFDILTKYIPTETITIFVAGMSALEPLKKGPWAPCVIYGVCAALTPTIYLMLAYAKQRGTIAQDKPFDPPTWFAVAATLAFLAWAWSVPGMAIPHVLGNEQARVIGPLAALLISTVLSLLDGVFGPVPNASRPAKGARIAPEPAAQGAH